VLLFAAEQAMSLSPAKKTCAYLFDPASSMYNYQPQGDSFGEYQRVQQGLEVRGSATLE
jgi:hypothetical protein